ncbi:YjfB family protein [Paenibacillus sp. GSMTC-2017]|uniref:YjfB family protein n=1 Tax=Paenibacillus sp. GSMTC-2017 TaxID=2794350 RepID=UPI0018D6E480|nr:YjfB family protein [Paenibacillus sp. GSMTC-2017]MBH5316723.1 YjfB family protein [Paenibacillus sp. GSMTC-2017]
MDIAALSILKSQSSLSQAVGLKVLNIAKDQAEQQGQQLVQMINQNLDPTRGQSIDLRV